MTCSRSSCGILFLLQILLVRQSSWYWRPAREPTRVIRHLCNGSFDDVVESYSGARQKQETNTEKITYIPRIASLFPLVPKTNIHRRIFQSTTESRSYCVFMCQVSAGDTGDWLPRRNQNQTGHQLLSSLSLIACVPPFFTTALFRAPLTS